MTRSEAVEAAAINIYRERISDNYYKRRSRLAGVTSNKWHPVDNLLNKSCLPTPGILIINVLVYFNRIRLSS